MMDDLDRKLLGLLKDDARAPLTDLASVLDVSRGTVRNRIQRLIDRRIVRRFTVELSQTSPENEINAFVLIRLEANDGQRAVIAMRKIQGVDAIHTLSGRFDVVVDLRVATLTALDHVLDRIRRIPDVAETQSQIRLADVSRRSKTY